MAPSTPASSSCSTPTTTASNQFFECASPDTHLKPPETDALPYESGPATWRPHARSKSSSHVPLVRGNSMSSDKSNSSAVSTPDQRQQWNDDIWGRAAKVRMGIATWRSFEEQEFLQQIQQMQQLKLN